MPKIDLRCKLELADEEVAHTFFEYKNSKHHEKTVELSCSHPEMLQFAQQKYHLQSGDRVQIPILVRTAGRRIDGCILVYAYEIDSGQTETITLTITHKQ